MSADEQAARLWAAVQQAAATLNVASTGLGTTLYVHPPIDVLLEVSALSGVEVGRRHDVRKSGVSGRWERTVEVSTRIGGVTVTFLAGEPVTVEPQAEGTP